MAWPELESNCANHYATQAYYEVLKCIDMLSEPFSFDGMEFHRLSSKMVGSQKNLALLFYNFSLEEECKSREQD